MADSETDITDAGYPNMIVVQGPMLLVCKKCGSYIHSPDQHNDYHAILEGDTNE